MSWQQYTDTLVNDRGLSKAALFSRQGDSVWAETGGLNLADGELQKLIHGFDDPSDLQASGAHLEGRKYYYLRSDEKSIYLRAQEDGAVAVRTKQAIVLGLYQAPSLGPVVTAAVERYADYLISQGY